ncbi:MAG: hypothetical protein KGQ40_01190, partial [Rhodospirillales bacterium]|nr:hypothetical protein [Rhodospirillales bacterium]
RHAEARGMVAAGLAGVRHGREAADIGRGDQGGMGAAMRAGTDQRDGGAGCGVVLGRWMVGGAWHGVGVPLILLAESGAAGMPQIRPWIMQWNCIPVIRKKLELHSRLRYRSLRPGRMPA